VLFSRSRLTPPASVVGVSSNVRPQNNLLMSLECRRAVPHDFQALQQMLELYQYELSDIWHQDLNQEGRYGYDLSRHQEGKSSFAYVALRDSVYVGFALVAPAAFTRSDGVWMEQFFILKRYRGTGTGRSLARHVFASHLGPWEVGQMPANRAAQAFWRKVIAEATRGNYTEVEVTHGWWQGVVQQFAAA
jgi:predicted acetyltransferase